MENPTIQDAPTIRPTMEDMRNFAELTARASDMALLYGAVLIEPPAEWCPPPLRMRPSSRFFVRTQLLPEAPFVDPLFARNLSTMPQHQNKRRGRASQTNEVNQDENGRLTKPITFRFSESPISLQAFKKRAEMNLSDLHRKLCADKQWRSRRSSTDDAWMKDVKCLEEIFWYSMRNGLHGKPISVDYGVDVEAEGAFDTQDMSYAEWYGNRSKHVNNESSKTTRAEPQFARIRKEHASPIASRHIGNVNDDSLLRHLPKMPGINHSMYYVGQLFTRFCWHTEDGFLNSISYLHEGSAEKIWYAVPPQHASKFEEYAAANVFSPTIANEEVSGQALLMNKTTMFDPKEVVRHGVPVYRVTHRPRSIVVTAPRGYHAGFNCGFNIAEAVNFAHPSWFPFGREASKFARKVLKPLCIPWEYLLYHEAKAIQSSLLPRAREGDLPQRMRRHAAIVAKELGRVICEGEKMITEHAKKANLRIKMITDINAVVEKCQVGPEYGPGAGIVCTLCGHACHFYAEVCGCCEGAEEARCPEHFGAEAALCENKQHTSVIVRRHNPLMLLDLLDSVEETGGVECSAEDYRKRLKSFLRPWQTPLRGSGLRLRIDLQRAIGREAPKTKRKREGPNHERKKKARSQDAKRVHFEAEEYVPEVT